MIYFMCPRPATPSGGALFIFRIVKLLNEMGHPALVWTPQPFAPWWSANLLPAEQAVTAIQPGQGDTVVVPEVNWPLALPDGVRQICFVQNYIWLNRTDMLRSQAEVLVCSRYLWNHMRRVFDANVIGKITPYLDEGVWPAGLEGKRSNRVFMLSRRQPSIDPHLTDRAARIFADNGFEVDYVTQPIGQREIAEHLSQAEFYAHFVYPEGWPAACCEAMRSNAVVVGTPGGGGNEFMHHNETAWVVQDPEHGRYNDPTEFINRVLEGLCGLRADPASRERIRQQAHQYSLQFDRDNTQRDLREIFR